MCKILVGIKLDREEARQVSIEEGKTLAAQYNVTFVETSAKDSKNVDEVFMLIANEMKSKADESGK